MSLGIALLAIGVAIGAWFRPLPKNEPPPAPTYSSQQVADAKAKVCAAYAKSITRYSPIQDEAATTTPRRSLASPQTHELHCLMVVNFF